MIGVESPAIRYDFIGPRDYLVNFTIHSPADLSCFGVVGSDSTPLELGSDYEVVRKFSDSYVRISDAAFPYQFLLIQRSIVIKQSLDIRNALERPREAFELQLDRIVMMLQDAFTGLSGFLRVPETDGYSPEPIPEADTRANTVIYFEDDENGTVSMSSAINPIDITTYMEGSLSTLTDQDHAEYHQLDELADEREDLYLTLPPLIFKLM